MASNLKILAQIQPAITTNVVLFSPQKGEQYLLKKLFVSNTGSSTIKIRTFVNKTAGTGAAVNAINYDINLIKETSMTIDLDIPLRNSNGAIVVRCDKANQGTFTLIGEKL